MGKYDNSPYQAVCEYLDSVGLDPSLIVADSVRIEGYDEFMFDGDKRIITTEGGWSLRNWNTWPTPEIGQRVMELMHKP